MDRTAFRIGEVASGAGVSVDTVRYYERLKLLPRANRSSGNFRLFAPESIERVRFIKQAHELGLTLEEIKGLLGVFSPTLPRSSTILAPIGTATI